MKIQETRKEPGGFGMPAVTQTRVRVLAAKEVMPEGATEVTDDTPESDWTPTVNAHPTVQSGGGFGG